MSEEATFIAAILADPEDEPARLVYADWLDERGDQRGEFLRAYRSWDESWGLTEPPGSLTDRLEELRKVIDPGWVALMTTLGLKSEPLELWREGCNPLTEPLAIRRFRGRVGQPGGLVTFASQFRLSEPPDAGLTEDLRVLADIGFDLGECHYGSSDFPIYPFIAELRVAESEPTAGEILTALRARDFRGEARPGYYADRITTDYDQQPFFSDEEAGRGTHGVLVRYVAPDRLWYVRLRTRNAEYPRDAVQFGVGASPHGDRLVGLVAGGWWS